MARIETLVDDIHALLLSEDPRTVSAHGMALMNQRISSTVSDRFSTKKSSGRPRNLRLSSIGKPARQLWYEAHDAKREPMPANTHIKFMYGDFIEAMMFFLIEESGHTVECVQEEVVVEGVKGHIDALIDGCLVDIKSASVKGFEKFKFKTIFNKTPFGFQLDDPFGYVMQLAAYNSAKKTPKLGWLAVEKEKGHLALPLYKAESFPFQPEDVTRHIKNLRVKIESNEIPERCYKPVPEGKSGNMALAVGCSYCPFKSVCWADANQGRGLRTFLYARGPKDLIHVEREPDVPELKA